MRVAVQSILVTGSSLGVERDTSPRVAWLIFHWWVWSLANLPPVQTAQRTSSYKANSASVLQDVLTSGHNKEIKQLTWALLPFFFFSLFHLFPLKLMLLPCDSHIYYVGHKTIVLKLCSPQFNFTMSLEGTSFFNESPWITSTYSYIFCPPHVITRTSGGRTCIKWRWRKQVKRKKTTMANQYIQIFVVWLLLSCSGLY